MHSGVDDEKIGTFVKQSTGQTSTLGVFAADTVRNTTMAWFVIPIKGQKSGISIGFK